MWQRLINATWASHAADVRAVMRHRGWLENQLAFVLAFWDFYPILSPLKCQIQIGEILDTCQSEVSARLYSGSSAVNKNLKV